MIVAFKPRAVLHAAVSACAVALGVGVFADAQASPAPTAGSCDYSGSWVISANYKVSANRNIDAGPQPQHLNATFTRDSSSSYTGRYVGINNTSTFTLRIFTSPTGRGQVVAIVQDGVAQSGYYAVYIGHVAAASCDIQGTWIDVADNAGDFKLTRR